MSKLIKLTSIRGDALYINPQNIESVMGNDEKGGTEIRAFMRESAYVVKESVEDVVKKIEKGNTFNFNNQIKDQDMEFLEGNKLIANFMGDQFSEDMEYDASWNLIMPVFEKINSLEEPWFETVDMVIEKRTTSIRVYQLDAEKDDWTYNCIWNISRGNDDSKILEIWGTIIDFINFYNTKK